MTGRALGSRRRESSLPPREEQALQSPGRRRARSAIGRTRFRASPRKPPRLGARRPPWLDLNGDGPLGPQPVASPFQGGVRIENYQLVPLLKALCMPRVSLLIADEVGLGKTVEARLIPTELLLRRRIRRVLILAPAPLRHQWRDELRDKFSLRFEIVDRKAAEGLRRRLGMDANPWPSFDRIVASYHDLWQPDVREQSLAASRVPEGSPQSPHLPWKLIENRLRQGERFVDQGNSHC